MNKFKILGAVASVMLLAPVAASAATTTNIKFDNGQTTTSCTAGQTVNMTFRINIPTGEVAELGQVDVLSDNIAPELPSMLGGELGLQEGPNDVQMNVVCPQNTGYYTVQFNTAGMYGGQRAVTMNDGVTSTASFGNAIRVVATSNGTSGSTSSTSISDLLALIASLKAQIDLLMHPVVPVTPAPTKPACPPTGNTAMVQVWLMNNGYGAGFFAVGLDANHPTNNWGPVTTSAYNQATAACK